MPGTPYDDPRQFLVTRSNRAETNVPILTENGTSLTHHDIRVATPITEVNGI